MSRISPFAHPLLLGFDAIEKTVERLAKSNDGYPPYNIEKFRARDGEPQRLRLTLAVAGFAPEELDVSTVDNQLIIHGKQADQADRDYLYRGIAARQFQRVFALSDGIQVSGAQLKNGLLLIDLIRPQINDVVKKINISVSQ